jgi:hypothetical protein
MPPRFSSILPGPMGELVTKSRSEYHWLPVRSDALIEMAIVLVSRSAPAARIISGRGEQRGVGVGDALIPGVGSEKIEAIGEALFDFGL